MAVRRWLAKGAGLNIAIALFAGLMIGMLWVFVITAQRAERGEIIATAVKQNSNLAVAYEEHVARTLKGLDAVLLFIRYEYQRLGTKMDIAGYIRDGIIDERLFSILSVVDRHGNVVLSSKSYDLINYADREHFRIHQLRRAQDTLYISAPVLGRISNTWQVPMTRRIILPDGSFGGIVVLSVDPGYFTSFYRKADIGANGVVLLVGLDGIARARRAGDKLTFGDDLSNTTLLRELSGNSTGRFVGGGGVDGTPRLVSYRALPGYPLAVAVGTAEDEVLADFVHNQRRDYRLALLVSVVITAFAAMLIVTLSRQKRAGVALALSEARFRATFEQAAIGIAHTSMERRYVQVNQKFCDMLGYGREELTGMKVSNLRRAGDAGDSSYVQQLLSGGATSLAAEKQYVRKDGSLIWVNRTISLVRDHAGNPLHFLRIVEDITERKRLEEELRELATTDTLTGLPNRRVFEQRLEEEHARILRFDAQQAAVLMLDLDNFKSINDAYGHPAGDEVLRQVALRIREQIRRVDMCGRLGGEEFAVLLAGATLAAAQEFAERLRLEIAGAVIAHEGRSIAVTTSIGIAVMKADDGNADAVLLRADAALYGAKGAGRDRVNVVND